MDAAARTQRIATLAGYFRWSERVGDLMRESTAQSHEHFLSTGDVPLSTPREIARQMVLIGYWHATLYVVVEGWQELRLHDDTIDALLEQSERVDLLRRFRNGMCHFQQSMRDDRFFAWLNDLAAQRWAEELRAAFRAFFAQAFPTWDDDRIFDHRGKRGESPP